MFPWKVNVATTLSPLWDKTTFKTPGLVNIPPDPVKVVVLPSSLGVAPFIVKDINKMRFGVVIYDFILFATVN